MSSHRRYPGSRPFLDNAIERRLFRGREDEKRQLLDMILANDLVLMFARSGTGKTSLLNAGILESLRQREFFPAMVRLDPGRFLEGVWSAIEREAGRREVEVEGPEVAPKNLVEALMHARLWKNDVLLTPVVIFDQFEELFTLHSEEEQAEIIDALSDLAARRLPHEEAEGARGMAYKLVFSMREDFLGELEEVATHVPTVLHHRFRLTPLTSAQAREAILEPASIEDPDLPTQAFSYTKEAVDQLVSFLSRRRHRHGYTQGDEVEPFQLQIICQHLETGLIEKTADEQTKVIDADALGGDEGMERVLTEFYNIQLESLPEEVRDAAHSLCEDGLVSPSGKRLSLEEEFISHQFGVERETLGQLVHLRILRAEPRVGSTYYELSHDTLVAAVQTTGAQRRPQILLARARESQGRGDIAFAMSSFMQYIETSPDDPNGYIEAIVLCVNAEAFDYAEQVLKMAAKRGLEGANFHFLSGQVHKSRDQWAAAAAEFEKAIALEPQNTSAFLALGEARKELGDPDGALDAAGRVLELEPEHTDAHQLILQIHVDRSQLNRLQTHMRQMAEEPFLALVESVASIVAMAGARVEVVEPILRDAIGRFRESPEALDQIATVARELGLFKTELQAYEAAIEGGSEVPRGLLGMCLHQLNRDDEAIAAYSHALAESPDDEALLLSRAWSLTNRQRHDEALADCMRVLEHNPDSGDALLYLGRNQSLGGDDEAAIESYERASQIKGDDAELMSLWATSLNTLGRFKGAEEVARRGIQADPANADAHFQLAAALSGLDRSEEAEQHLKRATELNPESAPIWGQWADLLFERSEYREALEKLRHADRLATGNPETLALWGASLCELQRFAEGEYRCEAALKADPDSYMALVYGGKSLAKLGKKDEAIEHFRKAAKLDVDRSLHYQFWSDVLFEVEDYKGAAEIEAKAFEEAEDDTTKVLSLERWSERLRRLHRHEEAAEKLEQALAIGPESTALYLALAMDYADLNRGDQARETLTRAESLERESEYDLGNLGWVYYQLKDYEKSLHYTRALLEQQPEELFARCNAGLALLCLGRAPEARAEYDIAIRIAEASTDPAEFEHHAVDDVAKALAANPGLSGAAELLAYLRSQAERLRRLQGNFDSTLGAKRGDRLT